MEKTTTINYKGNTVFRMDFSDTKSEKEIYSVIDETVASRFTKFVKENKPYMKKSAVFGMSGIARVVFNGVMKAAGRDIRSFETEDQAKDFLLKP